MKERPIIFSGQLVLKTLADLKNEIAGDDRTAIKVFPAQQHLVDQANLYHLWVLPPGVHLPFGLHHAGGGM